MKITNSVMKVKKLTVHQIIGVSRRIPASNFNQAVEIAKVFREENLAYIPQGEYFYGFWQMIAAIWCGGYIAGVQAERNHRNHTKSDTKVS